MTGINIESSLLFYDWLFIFNVSSSHFFFKLMKYGLEMFLFGHKIFITIKFQLEDEKELFKPVFYLFT